MSKIREQRRHLHAWAETAWLEFASTLYIAQELSALGWNLRLGTEIHQGERLGLPRAVEVAAAQARLDLPAYEAAWEKLQLRPGVAAEVLASYTGVVADLLSDPELPTIALRFDMDALPLRESTAPEHLPAAQGFGAQNGNCHACAHDGHMALGLALAAWLRECHGELQANFRLIFQPAEENVRGAKSMVRAGVLNGVSYFLGTHIGLGQAAGRIGVGTTDFLAVRQYLLTLHGKEAHAGLCPELGHNTILAGAELVQQLLSLPQRGDGLARLNVGVFQAGLASNIIAPEAKLTFEMRGGSSSIRDDLDRRSRLKIAGIALAHELTYDLELWGEADSFTSKHPDWAAAIGRELSQQGLAVDLQPAFKASEDVTLMLQAVEAAGGKACHLLIGAELAAAHHHPAFDFNEDCLDLGLEALKSCLRFLAQS